MAASPSSAGEPGALDRQRKRLSNTSTLMGRSTPVPAQEEEGTASSTAPGAGGSDLVDAGKPKAAAPTSDAATRVGTDSNHLFGSDHGGLLERLGAYLANYKVDTNHLAETTLLVSAAFGVAFALYRTSVPALRKPAYALTFQTIVTVWLHPLLRAVDRYFRYADHQTCDDAVTASPARRSAHRRSLKTHATLTRVSSRREGRQFESQMYDMIRHLPAGTPRTDARFVWGLPPTRYLRDARDQGLVAGLLSGPLLASACLLDAVSAERAVEAGHAPSPVGEWRLPPWPANVALPAWAGEPPPAHPAGLGSLSSARLALSSMHTLIFVINVIHIVAMHFAPPRWIAPARTIHRTRNFAILYGTITFGLVVAAPMGLLGLLQVSVAGHGSTTASGGLSLWEIILTSVLYQTTLLTTVSLGRRNFTYGELVVTVAFGVTVMTEAVSLTVARITRTMAPHTFRAPNALLVYQLALIVGGFAIGFLTSPLLYLSRSLAQRPIHRLRWPEKRRGHRKILSASFYALAAIFVAGVLGPWTQWLLHTNPWIWAIRFILGLETITSAPGTVGWRNWSVTTLALLAWWAACLTATAIFWAAAIPGGALPQTGSVFAPPGPAPLSGSPHAPPKALSPCHKWPWAQYVSLAWPFTRQFSRLSKPQWSNPCQSPVLHALPQSQVQGEASHTLGATTGAPEPAEQGPEPPSSIPSMHHKTSASSFKGEKSQDNTSNPSTGNRSKKPAIWLSLNAKRKFFHLLAIAVFIPGLLLNVCCLPYPSFPPLPSPSLMTTLFLSCGLTCILLL